MAKQNSTSLVKSDFYDESSTYTRSNFMISSKYRSTLFSNKLMAISLSRLASAQESEEGYLTVKVKGKDIQTLCDAKNNHDFFPRLANTAQSMTGQTIGWQNPERQEFEYISVVTKASYQDGEFKIEFHKDLKKYLKDLTQNYTKFSLEVMLSFKSTYSFRLYELLKSRAFYRKGEERDNNLFRIEFDINELRIDLGVVNAELTEVKRILNKSKGKPDYAKAVAASPEKTFAAWSDFRRCVIQEAVAEINSKPETGLYIQNFEPKKAGRGGKVYAVVFYVEKLSDKKEKKKEVVDTQELSRDDMLDDIMDLITGIRNRQARAIGEAAGWDMDLIKRNYEYSQTKDVDDIVGFMIRAVKEDWASEKRSPRKKSSKAADTNGFNNFLSRDYDYEELMQTVL